ncbi:MAG: hypothetical protein IKQ27_10000 [Lachnospiraceae bacterium]|nr:hypothetical protein [Lachnospiraceae bacterium]MBR6157280.1 hypothetical protein [Lachnospiraceae bacterium]
MKKKLKKHVIIVTVLVILAVSLIPIPRYLKDGGTVEYNALLYSVHQVNSLNLDGGYNVGTRVRILFWKVFDNVHAV